MHILSNIATGDKDIFIPRIKNEVNLVLNQDTLKPDHLNRIHQREYWYLYLIGWKRNYKSSYSRPSVSMLPTWIVDWARKDTLALGQMLLILRYDNALFLYICDEIFIQVKKPSVFSHSYYHLFRFQYIQDSKSFL